MNNIIYSDRADHAGRIFSQWFDEIHKKWIAKWLRDTKKLLSADHIFSDEYIKSELVYQAIYMAGLFKGGYFPAYADLYVSKRAAGALRREFQDMKLHVPLEHIEEPAKWDYDDDDQEKHQYGTYKIEKYKPLDQHIDEQDAVKRIQQIAEANGLGRLAELLREGLTERQMARELCQDQASIHRKIQKLRKLCSEAK